MREKSDRFHLLADELNPALVKKILSWRDHPELSRLVTKLLSHTSRKAFLDAFAEAQVANHLLGHRCQIRFEVPTPQGKRCDFEVHTRSGQMFYLHVKRLESELPLRTPRQLRAMSEQLSALERIPRPYLVQVRWNERLNAAQRRSLIRQADEFIRRARLGDEMVARENGGPIGGVRILAAWDGDHVNVMVGLRASEAGFVDQAPRFRKLMERAYRQFMPPRNGAVNVILIGSDHMDDAVEFENALRGSHIERWDAFPKRGKRLAHGRAEDGFWSGQRFAESRFAGWFLFAPQEKKMQSKLWVRDDPGVEGRMKDALRRIFGSQKA